MKFKKGSLAYTLFHHCMNNPYVLEKTIHKIAESMDKKTATADRVMRDLVVETNKNPYWGKATESDYQVTSDGVKFKAGYRTIIKPQTMNRQQRLETLNKR